MYDDIPEDERRMMARVFAMEDARKFRKELEAAVVPPEPAVQVSVQVSIDPAKVREAFASLTATESDP